MSDDLNRQPPAGPAFTHPGVGHYSGFLCAKCRRKRATMGRRMQFVQGAKQWVCRACVAERAVELGETDGEGA